MEALKHLPAWKTLDQHFKDMRRFDMRADPRRAVFGAAIGEHDGSTPGLIADIRRRRGLNT
jgi:hypothetical protein